MVPSRFSKTFSGPMNISIWQRMQDDLARITGFTIQTFLPDGTPICATSHENQFCRFLRDFPDSSLRCQTFCGKSLDEILQLRAPTTFKCPAHLTNFIIPYCVNDVVELFLFGGQVFTSYKDFSALLERAQQYKEFDQIVEQSKLVRFKDWEEFERGFHLVESSAKVILENLHSQDLYYQNVVRLLTLFNTCLNLNLYSAPSEIYAYVANMLLNLFEINTIGILVFDEQRKQFSAEFCRGWHKDAFEISHRREFDAWAVKVLTTKDPSFVDSPGLIKEFGFSPAIECMYIFPFRFGSKQHGVIVLLNTRLESTAYSIVSSFFRQIALTYESADLHSQLDSHQKILTFVSDLYTQVRSSAKEEEVYRFLVEEVAKLLDAQLCSLFVYDEQMGSLLVKVTKGFPKDALTHVRIRPGEHISGRVFIEERPVVVQNIESDQRFARPNNPRYKTKSFLCVPVRVNSHVAGVLNVADRLTGRPFSDEDLQTVLSILSYSSLAIERIHYFERSEALRKLSSIDGLTGLYNRRFLEERLAEEMSRSRRYGRNLSLLLLDIDDFKRYNDSFGHLEGDRALQLIAQSIMATVRKVDIVTRYGGEEFLIILPETEKSTARSIAERIITHIDRLGTSDDQEKLRDRLTVSIGLASFPVDAKDEKDLVGKADIALYEAKREGKNKLVLFDEVFKNRNIIDFSSGA
jgi:diguanylate cyclase (GGDEF)-like protein